MLPDSIRIFFIFYVGLLAVKTSNIFFLLKGRPNVITEHNDFDLDISWPVVFGVIHSDALIISILLAITLLVMFCGRTIAGFVFSCVLAALVIAYVADFMCLAFLYNRLIVFDIPRYIMSFQWLSLAILCLILLILAVIYKKPYQKEAHALGLASLIIPGALLLFYVTPLESSINYMKYDLLTNNLIENNLDITYLNEYSNNRKLASQYHSARKSIQGGGRRDNVVLLILESGSAVDSKSTSGIHDLTPGFDQMQSEGITYTNFIASSFATDTALISLLKGIDTIPFTNNPDNYRTFQSLDSPLPRFFTEHGYVTYFITTGPLDFLDKEAFLEEVGYEHILGSRGFEDERKYTFASAPDEDLYATAIDYLDDLHDTDKPYFMTLLSISQHLPYYTPYGFGKENMYRYTDDTLSEFYKELKEMNYFDNGILIVVGDHRKMTPLEAGEYEKYGISAYGRVVSTVIGKGITGNYIDKAVYQHSDMYYSIKRLYSDSTVMAPKYNDIFTGDIQRPFAINANIFSNRNLLAVVTGENSCKVRLDGDATHFHTCPAPPDLQQEILDYINTARAHQIHLKHQLN